MKKNKICLLKYLYLILLSVLVFSVTSCPDPTNPDIEDEFIVSEINLSQDGNDVTFRVVANKQVTCTEVTSGYDLTDVVMPLVEIEDELDAGSAEISFKCESGFNDQNHIAYFDNGWQIVSSTVESQGQIITATVDHFSVWTVIKLQPVEVKITGTVTINMGTAWNSMYLDPIAGKELSVILLDSATQEPIEGKYTVEMSEDWLVQSPGIFTFDYTLDGVAPGNYLVGSIIDMDGDGADDSDEPLMLYGGAEPTEIVISTDDDVSGVDITLETVSVSGTITLDSDFIGEYSSENIFLMLMTLENDEPVEARYVLDVNPKNIGQFDSTYSLDYTIEGIPTAFYIVGAFVDIIGNGVFDMEEGEPYGVIAENGNPTEPILVLLDGDITGADILIDTVFIPPEVEITSPADSSTQEEFVFDVSGTVADDENPAGELVSVAVFTPSNVNFSVDPPEFNGNPIAGDTAVIDTNGDWTAADIDLSSAGLGEFVIIALFEDSDGLTGGDYVEITIEVVYNSEGTTGTGGPVVLTEGIPYSGEVDNSYSYYIAPVTVGERYLITIDNSTDDAWPRIFSDIDFTSWIKYGAVLEPYDYAISYKAENSYIYLRVNVSSSSDGANYDLLIEPLAETFSVSGTINMQSGFSDTYPLILELIETEAFVGNVILSDSIAVDGASVDFTFSGILPGYYDFRVFNDVSGDGVWQAGVEYYDVMYDEWFIESVTDLSLWLEIE